MALSKFRKVYSATPSGRFVVTEGVTCGFNPNENYYRSLDTEHLIRLRDDLSKASRTVEFGADLYMAGVRAIQRILDERE